MVDYALRSKLKKKPGTIQERRRLARKTSRRVGPGNAAVLRLTSKELDALEAQSAFKSRK